MTITEFREILEARIGKTQTVLALKAKDYAPGADRLESFKQQAELLHRTPAQVCAGLFVKPLVWILNKIERGEVPSSEEIDEKLGDVVNYFILLEAIWREHLPRPSAVPSNQQCMAKKEYPAGYVEICQLREGHAGDHSFWSVGKRCPHVHHADRKMCALDAGHAGPHVFPEKMEAKGELTRCPNVIKGEQCALRIGHEGGCKWGRGD